MLMYSYFPVFQQFPAQFLLLIRSHNSHFRLKVFISWCKTILDNKFSLPLFYFLCVRLVGCKALVFEQKPKYPYTYFDSICFYCFPSCEGLFWPCQGCSQEVSFPIILIHLLDLCHPQVYLYLVQCGFQPDEEWLCVS